LGTPQEAGSAAEAVSTGGIADIQFGWTPSTISGQQNVSSARFPLRRLLGVFCPDLGLPSQLPPKLFANHTLEIANLRGYRNGTIPAREPTALDRELILPRCIGQAKSPWLR